MGADNILPVKGRKVTVGDNEYTIRYTMRTIAELARKYGSVQGVFEHFAPLADATITYDAIESLADMVSAGFSVNHPEVTPDYVMDNFDLSDINNITEDLLLSLMDVLNGNKKQDSKKESPQKA
jgi:hypothetical protein